MKKQELNIDASSKSVRQNQWRLFQAFKSVSSIQLNDENKVFEAELEELRRQLWVLKSKLGEENPFLVGETFESVEEELWES
jgi:hypothetical protein